MVEPSPQSQPGEIDWQAFYQEGIDDRIEYIQFIHQENRLFQEIREKHQSEWQIAIACEEILFENARKIQYLMERIANDRKELNRTQTKLG